MDVDLAQSAVDQALSGNWKEAIKINLQILKVNSQDVDALNRLARAYAELGFREKAKTTARKVIKIDPFNSIAQKALDKWKIARSGKLQNSISTSPEAFLEEAGKTKQVSLIHLGDANLLAQLNAGDRALLVRHAHRVSVLTQDGHYIGRLSDDLACRLRKFILLGNQYEVFLKSITPVEVWVFIRETARCQDLVDIPSFPAEKIEYVSFTSPELVHKKEDVALPEEE